MTETVAGASAPVALSLAGLSVMLAMPTHRDIPAQTVASLLGTADLMRSRGIPFECQLQVGGSIVTFARSKAAHCFLESDKTRLFWVDSDIVWKPEDFLHILALSSALDCVGAIYPSKSEPALFFLNYEREELASNELGCFEVKGLGLGFTCVQRHVMEKLAERAPKLKFPDAREPIPHIFRLDSDGDEARGEDMAFFADIKALGFPVWLDPNINLGHVGAKIYRGDFMSHLTKVPHDG